ncbi:MAG: TetR family transcriptional regulator [Bauldia sp.]
MIRTKAREDVRALAEELHATRGIAPPAGRRRDAEATKQAILEAARDAFSHAGYDQVGLREIARRAGVDVALIGRYFGSKEELFVAVLSAGRPPKPQPYPNDRSTLGERIAREIVSRQDPDPTRLLLFQHSVASPGAAAIIRRLVTEHVIGPLGASLGGPDGELRASIIYAQLMGLGVARRLIRLDPLADAEAETLIALVGRAIQAVIDAPAAVPS